MAFPKTARLEKDPLEGRGENVRVRKDCDIQAGPCSLLQPQHPSLEQGFLNCLLNGSNSPPDLFFTLIFHYRNLILCVKIRDKNERVEGGGAGEEVKSAWGEANGNINPYKRPFA